MEIRKKIESWVSIIAGLLIVIIGFYKFFFTPYWMGLIIYIFGGIILVISILNYPLEERENAT